MALYRFFCALDLRPLRQRLHHLHLPLPSWGCFLRHLGLADIRLWLLLHCFVRR